jgi:5'-nucleotidase
LLFFSPLNGRWSKKMNFDLEKIAKAAALSIAGTAMLSSADAALVINEVYQGGGNSGATLNADFVELTNNGTATVTFTSGVTIEYGAATGYFATNTFTIFTTPSLSLLPGQDYLIGGAASTTNTTAAALVGVDFTTSLNAATAGGKVRILDGTTVLDLVGWGTATATPTTAPTTGFSGAGFEGTGPATGPGGNLLSITRTLGIDTDSNPADFVTSAPTPTGSVTPEPTTLGLAAAAGALFIGRRRRSK